MRVDQLLQDLTALGLEPERAQGGAAVRVPSRHRGSLAVHVVPRERATLLTVFLMRRPDRAHEDVYRRALRRNLGTGRWRFAVDDDGDLYLTCVAEPGSEGNLDLDGLLGELVVLVDETYEGLMRTGFEVPPAQDRD